MGEEPLVFALKDAERLSVIFDKARQPPSQLDSAERNGSP
jgi:hypothetical protein